MMPMADSLDEASYDQEVDGVLVRRQLERVVLARGAWATVMFLYEELDRETGGFGAAKIAVVRFRKLRGAYRKQSAFAIAGAAQAREVNAVLARWAEKMSQDEGDEQAEEADDGDGHAIFGEVRET
jgi:hypothetical protein